MPDFASDFDSVLSNIENKNKAYGELLNTIFFTKDVAFEYEDEKRLLVYADDKSEDYCSCKFDYMKKIIFGKRCSKDMKYLVSCINKQVYHNSIELYQINDHFQEEIYNGQ